MKSKSRTPPSITAPSHPRCRAAFDIISPQCAQFTLPPHAHTDTVPGRIRSNIRNRVAVSSSAARPVGAPRPVKANPATRFAAVRGPNPRGNTCSRNPRLSKMSAIAPV